MPSVVLGRAIKKPWFALVPPVTHFCTNAVPAAPKGINSCPVKVGAIVVNGVASRSEVSLAPGATHGVAARRLFHVTLAPDHAWFTAKRLKTEIDVPVIETLNEASKTRAVLGITETSKTRRQDRSCVLPSAMQ